MLKLYKFNNLNKNINICLYNIYYINNIIEFKKYNQYINNILNSKKIIKILNKICKSINCKIIYINKKKYCNGINIYILINDNINNKITISYNINYIYFNIYTYNYNNIYFFKIDINIYTCSIKNPLKSINYIINKFKSNIIVIDYKIRGYNLDINNKKIFLDHKINSIQNFISKNIKKKYDIIDINIYQENIFYTKMISKYIKKNFLKFKFNIKNKINKKKLYLILQEIYEIYYSKNIN